MRTTGVITKRTRDFSFGWCRHGMKPALNRPTFQSDSAKHARSYQSANSVSAGWISSSFNSSQESTKKNWPSFATEPTGKPGKSCEDISATFNPYAVPFSRAIETLTERLISSMIIVGAAINKSISTKYGLRDV